MSKEKQENFKETGKAVYYPTIAYPPQEMQDDEIDLIELWQTIWKHKKFVTIFTAIVTIAAVIFSLLEPNVYKSQAVILPTQQGGGSQGSSLISQYSGIASMVGINLPVSGSSQDIMAILQSKSLKKGIIEKYNLLPVILYKQWDEKNRRWKKNHGLIYTIKHMLGIYKKQTPEYEEQLRMALAIKALSNMMNVDEDKKLNTITVSVEYPKKPEVSASIVEDLLDALKNRMTSEAIKIAKQRESMLKNELEKTSDPTIQQKIYSLIAKQAETIAMAKVSEDFAFKVIDPPIVPVFKYKPKRVLIVVVAFITGLILSIFIVFFIEFVKNAKKRVASEEEN